MNIVQTYNKVVTDLRKSRNGFYSITQFNADAERAQLDAYTQYLEGYSVNQKLHDALSVFKSSYTFTKTTSPNGLITMPDDYVHLLSSSLILYDNATQTPYNARVTFVNEDERDIRLKSQIRPVSKSKPIAVGGNKSIQLDPAQAAAGTISYLRLPLAPVYAYTLNGRQIIYDAANSQDIEFNDLYMSNIIAKIVGYAAQYLDDQSSTQYSQTTQKATA